MSYPDQDDFNMQQDFDEFDTMVDDDLDILEEDYADNPDTRKKRQTVFYLALVFMLLIGGGAAWFLFFRPADTVTPLPMPGSLPPSAESQALPPQIDAPDAQQSTQNDLLPPMANQNNADMPPMTGLDHNQQPPQDLPSGDIQPPQDGTLVEGLMPPAAPVDDFDQTATTNTDLAPLVPAPNGDHTAIIPQNDTIAPMADPVAETAAAPAPSEDIMPQQAMPAAPVTEPAPAQDVIPVIAPAQAAQEQTASISDEIAQQLQQRLADMENHIQSLTKELQDVRNAPSAAPAQDDSISSSQLNAINEKLDSLAQQVDALDQRTTTFATELQKQADAATATPKPAAPAPKPAPAPVAKKPAPRATAPAARPQPTSVGGWELRSAQPGVAWLGRQGSSEMGRYAVGQNVPGLGTVQQVQMEGGRWIVKTTGGTLRQ